MKYIGNSIYEIASDELDSLPSYKGETAPVGAHFRGVSATSGHDPMVVEIQKDPLLGVRVRWFHIKVGS
jgi:hypothetical protein